MLTRSSSIPLIEAWRTESGSPLGADAAASRLRHDYERWSRLGLGVVAYVAAVCGVFAIGMMLDMLAAHARDALEVTVSVAIGLVGIAIATGAVILLYRLWRTGRELSRAAAWWMRLPYRQGLRARRAGGWLQARTINFEPPVFARIMACSLTFLMATFGLSTLAYPGRSEMPSMVAAFAVIGLLSLLCALGLMGGVLNIVSGVSERDPLWDRIRGAFSAE